MKGVFLKCLIEESNEDARPIGVLKPIGHCLCPRVNAAQERPKRVIRSVGREKRVQSAFGDREGWYSCALEACPHIGFLACSCDVAPNPSGQRLNRKKVAD